MFYLLTLFFTAGALQIFDQIGNVDTSPIQAAFSDNLFQNTAVVIDAPLSQEHLLTLTLYSQTVVQKTPEDLLLFIITDLAHNFTRSSCPPVNHKSPKTFHVSKNRLDYHRFDYRCLLSSEPPEALVQLLDKSYKQTNRRKLQELDEELNCGEVRLIRDGECQQSVEDGDLILILDSSTSIYRTEYDDMLSFVRELVTNVPATYGVLQYSSIVDIAWQVGDYTTTADTLAAVDTLTQLGGATYTKTAVEVALDDMLPLANPNNPTFIVLMTDGAPSLNQNPCELSSRIVDEGITFVVVGIAEVTLGDMDQVACLANPNDNVFTAETFSDLQDEFQSIRASICDPSTPYDGIYVQAEWDPQTFYNVEDASYMLQWRDEKDRWAFWYYALGFMTMIEDMPLGSGESWLLEFTGDIYDAVSLYCTTESPTQILHPTMNPTRFPIADDTTTPNPTIATKSPSRTPFDTHHIVTGSSSPTKTPTTTSMPSISPIETFTLPPTKYTFPNESCNVLYATHYRNCYKSMMDWIFVIDSGNLNNSEFTHVQGFMADIVEEVFFYSIYSNPRMAIVQYGASAHVTRNLDDPEHPLTSITELTCVDRTFSGTPWMSLADSAVTCSTYESMGLCDEFGSQINSFGMSATMSCCTCGGGQTGDRVTGTGATLGDALGAVASDVLPVTVNQVPDRERVVVILTTSDDDTSACNYADLYEDSFVYIYLIGNYETFPYTCMDGTLMQVSNVFELNYLQAEEGICNYKDIPFDAYFLLQDDLYEGYPYYTSAQGFQIKREIEGWQVTDSISENDGGLGLLISRFLPETEHRPPDFLTWDYIYSGMTDFYENVRIYCPPAGTPGPSRMPSVSPTTSPSKFPTEQCRNFLLASTPCGILGGTVDAVFVVDSSSSITAEDYAIFKEFLAVGIDYFLPPGSRMGLMQYSTNQHIEFNLGETTVRDEWLHRINKMEQLGGQTWTKNAMQYALDEMWTLSPDERTRIAVLFSDGQPTGEDQSPCDLYPEYLRQNIQILVVGTLSHINSSVGDEIANYTDSLVCLDHPDIQLLLLENYLSSFEEVQRVYDFICPAASPFDAGYSQTGLFTSGYPTYRSNLDWLAYWNAAEDRWYFEDPGNGGYMYLEDPFYDNLLSPPDRMTWIYVNVSNVTYASDLVSSDIQFIVDVSDSVCEGEEATGVAECDNLSFQHVFMANVLGEALRDDATMGLIGFGGTPANRIPMKTLNGANANTALIYNQHELIDGDSKLGLAIEYYYSNSLADQHERFDDGKNQAIVILLDTFSTDDVCSSDWLSATQDFEVFVVAVGDEAGEIIASLDCLRPFTGMVAESYEDLPELGDNLGELIASTAIYGTSKWENVRVICTNTVIPTLYPSTVPTRTPSVLPTGTPSVNPSVSPSYMPTIAPTDCCQAIPYLIEKLQACYLQLGNSSNPLLVMLSAFFQCPNILETCILTDASGQLIYTNHTEFVNGSVTETTIALEGLCCDWRDEIIKLIEECEILVLYDTYGEDWTNATNCTSDEEILDLRECYANLEANLTEIEERVETCEENVEILTPLYTIVNVDEHVEYWETAVTNGGLSCSFVPPDICPRLTLACELIDGNCFALVSTASLSGEGGGTSSADTAAATTMAAAESTIETETTYGT